MATGVLVVTAAHHHPTRITRSQERRRRTISGSSSRVFFSSSFFSIFFQHASHARIHTENNLTGHHIHLTLTRVLQGIKKEEECRKRKKEK